LFLEAVEMATVTSTIFSLSKYTLLDNNVVAVTSEDSSPVEEGTSTRQSAGRVVGLEEKQKTCLTCGIASFVDIVDQREHFKTDWHRYNVKLRVQNKPRVSEEEFTAMVERDEDDVASISGSDSDEEYDGDIEGVSGRNKAFRATLAPYYVLRVQGIEDGEQVVGVWKCLVDGENASDVFHKVVGMKDKLHRWAVVMFQGGHFAACVYEIQCPSDSVLKNQDRPTHEVAELSIKEIQHKSFHRYVVRAKAGGKQSDKDATGKFARSAGSRLRRYNEAALQKQIVETMKEWSSVLSECSHIFVSCPGSNRLVLFSGDAPPLDKTDYRIRKIPFVTRRPTISETRRVVRTLLTLYSFENVERKANEGKRKEQDEEEEEMKHLAEKHLQKQQAEEQRLAAKMELQKQAEIAKERNRKKKEKQKEKRRMAKSAAAEKQDESEIDLDAQLQGLAIAAAAGSKAKRLVRQQPSKARSKVSSENIDDRREKLAAAAEARAKALASASAEQKLW